VVNETPSDRGSGYQGRLSIRGTGVHLHDGYIVTARHAVERDQGSKKVLPRDILVLTDDFAEFPAHLVGGSAYLDLVLYRIDEAHRDHVKAFVSLAGNDARAGDPVFTVGYPLGWGPAIAYGRIGNPNTFLPTADTRLLQVDVSACSGNSGGGLFNEAGELVGILHAIIQTEQIQTEQRCSRFAFAVPGILVKRIVAALVDGVRPQFSRLGIQMTAVKVGATWRIAAADVSGAAKEGGVQKGDILVAIDGTEITDAAQLKNYLMERTMPGQKVTLRVHRGAQELTLSIILGDSER